MVYDGGVSRESILGATAAHSIASDNWHNHHALLQERYQFGRWPTGKLTVTPSTEYMME